MVQEFVQTYWKAKSSNFTWSWCKAILFQDSPSHQLIYGVRLVRFGYIKQREDQFSGVPLKVEVENKILEKETSFGIQHLSGANVEVGVWRIMVPVLWSPCDPERFLDPLDPLIRPLLGGFQAGWISGNKHKFTTVHFHQIFQNTLQQEGIKADKKDWSSEKQSFRIFKSMNVEI